MKANSLSAGLLLALFTGCSGRYEAPPNLRETEQLEAKQAPSASESLDSVASKRAKQEAVAFVDNPPGQPGGGQAPKKVARRIKYTAELKLITDDFDNTRQELQKAIKANQGYEAMADIKSSPGLPRVANWRLRVPIENFTTFREAVRKLAEVESDTVATEDLTEQYYDLEANIKNLHAEQESWRDMLKRSSDKVENLIAVKKELDRVTDEIQRKEGKIRLIANLTELTTVDVTLRERQKFTPSKGPDVVEAATFSMKAGKTFGESWTALRNFGEALALFAIGLAPWLPVIATVGVSGWWFVRRQVRAAAAAPVTPSQNP